MSEVTITPEDPYYLRLTQNQIADHRIIIRNGFNADVDSIADESVWSGGGLYFFPNAPVIIRAASTNPNDNGSGNGARTLKVVGLDASYNEIEDTITLNGQTPVELPRPYLRVNDVEVMTAGPAQANGGNISVSSGTFTGGVSTVGLVGHIPANFNNSQACPFTVPVGWTAYIVDITGSASIIGNNQRTILVTRAREFGGLFKTYGGVSIWGSPFSVIQTAFRGYPEKTDIDALITTTVSNVWVSAIQRYILIRNIV